LSRATSGNSYLMREGTDVERTAKGARTHRPSLSHCWTADSFHHNGEADIVRLCYSKSRHVVLCLQMSPSPVRAASPVIGSDHDSDWWVLGGEGWTGASGR
jgi:hypothetical protein